jgi:hypothetical protein
MRYNFGLKVLNTYQSGQVKCAMVKIRNDKKLMSVMEGMFQLKGRIPHAEITDFNEWIETLCKDVVLEDKVLYYLNIYWAVRITMMGTEESKIVAKELEGEAELCEINDYEEEVHVYGHVWIKGNDENIESLAEKAMQRYKEMGFGVWVCYDEEMDGEATVTAVKPIADYINQNGKVGVRGE